MSLISSMRNRYLAWSHSTPLPGLPGTAPPVFQHWHVFNETTSSWEVLQPGLSHTSTPVPQPPNLRLLTWNIDAFGERPESRIAAILSRTREIIADGNGPDIIFLQEVSKAALAHILQDGWVRGNWISSEADETSWAGAPFATMTLLSRARFDNSSSSSSPESAAASPGTTPSSAWGFSLGPVFRIRYPSRFGRDALCCDVLWDRSTRVRLVNVHLDSLPIEPNLRPRQVSLATDLVRATGGGGRGVIAGDWNPVSEGDAGLVADNGLVDAWERLRGGDREEDGFTWGLGGTGAPFPPGRLDKVAVLGLGVAGIEVVHPGTLRPAEGGGSDGGEEGVPWSDHSGLMCSFSIFDAVD